MCVQGRHPFSSPLPARSRANLVFSFLFSLLPPVASQHGGNDDGEENATKRNGDRGGVTHQECDRVKAHFVNRGSNHATNSPQRKTG
jgi:hypothetical protein